MLSGYASVVQADRAVLCPPDQDLAATGRVQIRSGRLMSLSWMVYCVPSLPSSRKNSVAAAAVLGGTRSAGGGGGVCFFFFRRADEAIRRIMTSSTMAPPPQRR